MFLWRKFAELRWLKAHENLLQTRAQGRLVIVHRTDRKRLQVEIVSSSRRVSRALVAEFGGRAEKLPHNWLERFTFRESKPIKIGKRLIVARSINELQICSVRYPQRSPHRGAERSTLRTAHATARIGETRFLIIPASTAFGTGEHVTTAMSLRFLEQLTRGWKPGWSLVDLGTGSGILALAAKRLGADRVIGIDNDSSVISMAKSNARLNKIRGVSFQFGDVHKWNSAQKTDVITANLYSDLLIEILPKLAGNGWLILSGIFRSQKDELVRALQRNHLDIISMKRRGKWMAFLSRRGRHTATVKP